MATLLLHTCCGPCFLGSFEGLAGQDFEITNYFYNPNIQPQAEYVRRLSALKIAAEGRSKAIMIENYDSQEHQKAIAGHETDFPRRCLDCYRFRLAQTARKAQEDGFDFFSTTLLVSPYQQHEALKEIGEKVAAENGIAFYYQDLRPYFRSGQGLAREKGIYRQKYCGCLYSKESK